MKIKNTALLFLFLVISCGKGLKVNERKVSDMLSERQKPLIVGAGNTMVYLPMLQHKKVGVVANQTSVIATQKKTYVHLVDSLLSSGISVIRVYAPEHGFRGTADAGERVNDGIDNSTGLPVISLYGKNKKPTASQLKDIDIMVFDIQDVGVRFYTYISTLHYVMEACASEGIPVLVLDRPNPNRHYIDGPVLDMQHRSFIGMHPVPIVYGMTIGEYAQMINGEHWLDNNRQCELYIIPIQNYRYKDSYNLPIRPSPNLPNDKAIQLYPSLCFFEGTSVSVGRGTSMQFQVYGSPFLPESEFFFIPEPNTGAKKPLHKGKICYGENLSTAELLPQLCLNWLLKAYRNTTHKERFFKPSFEKLAGTEMLRQQIRAGLGEDRIRKSWEKGLENFKSIRQKYVIYDDKL